MNRASRTLNWTHVCTVQYTYMYMYVYMYMQYHSSYKTSESELFKFCAETLRNRRNVGRTYQVRRQNKSEYRKTC